MRIGEIEEITQIPDPVEPEAIPEPVEAPAQEPVREPVPA